MDLKIEKFESWLRAFEPEKRVTEYREELCCPLESFLIDSTGDLNPIVGMKDYWIFGQNKDLPEWAGSFVHIVDCEIRALWHTLTAKDCLEVLERVKANAAEA